MLMKDQFQSLLYARELSKEFSHINKSSCFCECILVLMVSVLFTPCFTLYFLLLIVLITFCIISVCISLPQKNTGTILLHELY